MQNTDRASSEEAKQPLIVADALAQLEDNKLPYSLREQIAESLIAVAPDDTTVWNWCLRAARGRGKMVAHLAIMILRDIGVGHPTVIETLLEIAGNQRKESGVRRAAVLTLREVAVGKDAAIERCLQWLEMGDSDQEFLRCVVVVLGVIGAGNPRVIDAVLEKLLNQEQEILMREAAVEALRTGAVGHSGAILALGTILLDARYRDPFDRHTRLQSVAMDALPVIAVGMPEGIHVLSRVVEDSRSDAEIRTKAAYILSILGRADTAFLEQCRQWMMATEGDPKVRDLARYILHNIEEAAEQPTPI